MTGFVDFYESFGTKYEPASSTLLVLYSQKTCFQAKDLRGRLRLARAATNPPFNR